MASQDIGINFAQGLNTKTDPWQLPIGQFLALENMVFTQGNLLSKREGYLPIPNAPSGAAYLTTLNDNLLAIGDTINADCATIDTFVTKGNLQPCSLSVSPVIRNNLNQIQVDSAISMGLVCTVYTQQNSTPSGLVTSYLYAIQDAMTEQNIVPPTPIPALATGVISGSSKVIVVGNFFVILSPCFISPSTFLQYVAIPLLNVQSSLPPQNIYPEVYTPISDNPGWDVEVSSDLDVMVVAYNTLAGGQGVHVTTLTAQQIAANQISGVVHTFAGATFKASILSLTADKTVSPNIYYVSFWNDSTTNGYTAAVFVGFGSITTQFTPVQTFTAEDLVNITSAAQNGLAHVYGEMDLSYSYDSSIPSHFIRCIPVSDAGSVGSETTIIRSVGLASDAFIINGIEYFLSAYQSPFQPSYFLINASVSTEASPVIVAKLAYQNGGGYLPRGLPGVNLSGSTVSIPYLFKQNVEALNTISNPQQTSTGGIYSQLGINLASIRIGTQNIQSAEIAQDLHLSGGYLSMFDSNYPVEHNFFVFPDSIEAEWIEDSSVTPTGTFASGSKTITVSSPTDIYPGMAISDTANPSFIPAGTTVVYVSGSVLTISQATTSAGTNDALLISGTIVAKPDGTTNAGAYFYQVTYEWTDAKGNAFLSQPSIAISVTTTGSGSTGAIILQGPMLRLTQKVLTLPKIVIYRWSVETQVYNQVTSIQAPLLNDTSVDSWTFVDTLPDANVVGNNLIYTTGGVVPNTNGPASNILALFDTRLFVVDAEDPNLVWPSKTVVEGVPVEMSSAFTIYVAPNVGTTQSTGPVQALFPMDDKLIFFKKNSIFYMNGTGPDNLGTTSPGSPLGNYSPPTFITAVVGCTNQSSIVLTDRGLMFQSDKGIWLLNRNLETSYIGAAVEAYNDFEVTSAIVIPGTNFVIFTLNTKTLLMYDYYYNQWGTWNGPNPVVSSCIYNGRHTILTDRGEILQQTPNQYVDVSTPVLLGFKTSWINLASLQGYQRFYEFYLLGKYLSPHTLQVNVAYNYVESAYHSTTIRPQNFSPSVPSPYGVPTPFGSMAPIEQWRIHAKQQLCQSFQISIQEVYDPNYGTLAGAGLTLSGITCEVEIKKARRPIRGANAVG